MGASFQDEVMSQERTRTLQDNSLRRLWRGTWAGSGTHKHTCWSWTELQSLQTTRMNCWLKSTEVHWGDSRHREKDGKWLVLYRPLTFPTPLPTSVTPATSQHPTALHVQSGLPTMPDIPVWGRKPTAPLLIDPDPGEHGGRIVISDPVSLIM